MNEQQAPQIEQQPQPQPIDAPSSAQPAFEEELTTLRTENSELKHQLRLINARDQLTRTLTSENARSPELLFEAAVSKLAFDEDGKLNNLSDIIADIKSRFPEQFVVEKVEPPRFGSPPARGGVAPASGDEVVGVPPRAINAGAGRIGIRPPLTKEMLAAMKPRDIANLNWHDVKQAMEA